MFFCIVAGGAQATQEGKPCLAAPPLLAHNLDGRYLGRRAHVRAAAGRVVKGGNLHDAHCARDLGRPAQRNAP